MSRISHFITPIIQDMELNHERWYCDIDGNRLYTGGNNGACQSVIYHIPPIGGKLH